MNKQLRWIPAIAVPALVVAGAVAVPAMATASVNLPHKSAAQIVALAQKSGGSSFSGTVEQTANLGLPDLSSLQGAQGGSGDSGSVSDIVSQLSGTHKARVFASGSNKSRIQTLDQLSERDVIRNGDSVWAYDSSSKKAVHATIPSSGDRSLPSAVPSSPTDIADQVLAQIDDYTTVTTSSNVRVAGQKAYQITLTPKNDTTTLVGDVTLAVDASTGIPLRAAITAAGQTDPAYSVAFTSIDYSTPSASTFAFTPPKGTAVKTITAPTSASSSKHFVHPGAVSREDGVAKSEAEPTVTGTGWSTVVGLTLPAGDTLALSGSQAGMLHQVTTAVAGGRLLQTSLVSVLLTDDGHVYVGAVKPSALEAAAGE